MRLARAWHVLRKDLRLGPRSPIVLWAVVVPIALTLLIQGVFGELFEGEPRVGLADDGDSALAAAVERVDGLDVHRYDDADALRTDVTEGRLDAGLALPAGFDAAVQDGARPPLPLWVAGESLPADRALVSVTVIDQVRALAGDEATVEVTTVALGEEALPIDVRLLPLLVMYAVTIPGGMVPAASLVEEKEHGTLAAVLASPASVGEVVLAKGALGVLLGSAAGLATLALNDAFGPSPVAVMLAIAVGVVMMAMLGLLLGSWAQDTNTLFAAWKALGIIIFIPVIFFIWPDLPTWPAYLMPAYYFLSPAYAAGVEGAALGEVALELAIGAALCVALLPAVIAAGRSMARRLVAGRRDAPSAEAAQPVPAGQAE